MCSNFFLSMQSLIVPRKIHGWILKRWISALSRITLLFVLTIAFFFLFASSFFFYFPFRFATCERCNRFVSLKLIHGGWIEFAGTNGCQLPQPALIIIRSSGVCPGAYALLVFKLRYCRTIVSFVRIRPGKRYSAARRSSNYVQFHCILLGPFPIKSDYMKNWWAVLVPVHLPIFHSCALLDFPKVWTLVTAVL